jgi:hypothetical protein
LLKNTPKTFFKRKNPFNFDNRRQNLFQADWDFSCGIRKIIPDLCPSSGPATYHLKSFFRLIRFLIGLAGRPFFNLWIGRRRRGGLPKRLFKKSSAIPLFSPTLRTLIRKKTED